MRTVSSHNLSDIILKAQFDAEYNEKEHFNNYSISRFWDRFQIWANSGQNHINMYKSRTNDRIRVIDRIIEMAFNTEYNEYMKKLIWG